MSHHIFTKGTWCRARLAGHPTVQLSIAPDRKPTNKSIVTAVADSGAQSDVWSLHEYLNAGYLQRDLQPATLSLTAANKSPIHINGAFFARLSGCCAVGTSVTTRAMVYVSHDVKRLYLSETTMSGLGMLPQNFPTPGCALPSKTTECSPVNDHSAITPNLHSEPTSSLSAVNNRNDNQQNTKTEDIPPPREPVPPPPTEFPVRCIPENNGEIRDFLLHYYRLSVFHHRSLDPLPEMAGPPMELHVDENATPYVCHNPRPVPISWEDQYERDLLRDEAQHVIERVPFGVPVTWYHRMVLREKNDGSPRRTIDLSPLNNYCKRETHSIESPIVVARRVPANTWKTVTDASNGYHSIPLRKSDRHLTTFATRNHGRWRYRRAVQGYVSSGDGLNRRFDAILADFPRKERLMDDKLHYDTDLEEHWWRTIELLDLVGRFGIVLNLDKFQFAQREVDFVGCRITNDKVEILPKFFNAILDFPTPTNATYIKRC